MAFARLTYVESLRDIHARRRVGQPKLHHNVQQKVLSIGQIRRPEARGNFLSTALGEAPKATLPLRHPIS